MTSLMASSPAGWDDRWGEVKGGFCGWKKWGRGNLLVRVTDWIA